MKVIVSVDDVFVPTLVGTNAAATVGAIGFTVTAAGHALWAVPAVAGAVVVAPVALTVMTAVSVAPVESVTSTVTVPGLPLVVAVGPFAADVSVTLPLVLQA